MLHNCPHCGVGLEYSPRDPVTAVLHVADCKHTAPPGGKVVSTKMSARQLNEHIHEYYLERVEQAGETKISTTQPSGEVREYFERDYEHDPKWSARQNARLCPVCKQPVVGLCGLPYHERPDHFNSCWVDLVAAVTRQDTSAMSTSQMPETMLPPPTPSLSKRIPAPPSNASIPESACLTCARNLSTCSDVDALCHRAVCFAGQSDKSCPICKGELSAAEGFLASSLLHLQRCQQVDENCHSFIGSDDFEALYMSLCGRTEITDRFKKRIRGGSRNSRLSFHCKIQRKRDHVDLLYTCGESALRKCINVDGDEFEGWRTAGDVGKATRNVFSVVEEDFDPFIIMEGPRTQLLYPPTQPINSAMATSNTSNASNASNTLSKTADQSLVPPQHAPETEPVDTNPFHALPKTEARPEVETQVDSPVHIIYALPMFAVNLPQVQKCVFCVADPQGTHKRFDKIEKANVIRCDKKYHVISTCGRCTANYHTVAESTPATEAHTLPRIILTSPDSKHARILESFTPDKEALYPASKRRGRANWMGYNWTPDVLEVKNEKARQAARARNRSIRRENRTYESVQLLAVGALASTPVAFFPQNKAAAGTSNAARSTAHMNASPVPLMGTRSPPSSAVKLSEFSNAWSNAITSQGQELVPSDQSFADIVRDGGRKQKDLRKDSKSQKTGLGNPIVAEFGNRVKSLDRTVVRILDNFHISKPCSQGVRGGERTHEAHLGSLVSPPKESSPAVTFSSVATRPQPDIAFGAVRTGADRTILPQGIASYVDLANGSASYRPFLSPCVYALSFTTTPELHEVEEPSSPFSRPPSPAWSATSSTSTDSSCLSEADMGVGWDALA